MSESMYLDSIRNRIRAMNVLWERAISDMTLEQVNHHEREGVLPIAFSFSHYIRAQDQSISRPIRGESSIWESGAWAEKVGVTVDFFGREETVEEMQHLRFRDLDAWKAYQAAVIERTDETLETITTEHAEHLLRDRHRRRTPPEARGVGVLRLPARAAPHGRDRARAGAGGAARDDELVLVGGLATRVS
jgi:hypothetical protein